jgi:hypothetical protein
MKIYHSFQSIDRSIWIFRQLEEAFDSYTWCSRSWNKQIYNFHDIFCAQKKSKVLNHCWIRGAAGFASISTFRAVPSTLTPTTSDRRVYKESLRTWQGVGRDSSVGIATDLWAGFSGIRIPVGGEIFRTCPDRPWGPPSLLYNGYRVFPGGKAARAWRWSSTLI